MIYTWCVPLSLTTRFGVARLDLVLLPHALLSPVLGRGAGAGAGADGPTTTAALVTAGPGTPPGPTSVHCFTATRQAVGSNFTVKRTG